jgi:hypothetical protein
VSRSISRAARESYLINKRHLILTDHVKISKPTRQQVLLSERLEYDDADKMLVSPGKV